MEQTSAREPVFNDPSFTHPPASAPDNYFSHDNEKSSLAFRTISEVAHELEVPQHVLRFWESRFTQIKPLKRGGGRRYYRPDDIELLRRIKNYLYKQGYTIKGVQRLLKENRAMPQPQAPSFVPYAHPLAGMPGYQMPSAILGLKASPYLQSAAAAPSAMAMAYGAVSNTLHAEGQQIRDFEQKAERFADAFQELTVQGEAKKADAPSDQLSQSLEVVTEIRDELAHPVEPIRVEARAEVLEELSQRMTAEPALMPELELPFSGDELEAVQEVEASIEIEEVAVTLEVERYIEPEIEALAEEKSVQRAELKALLAELVSLREMLNTGLAA
jgi:DNA-binding transcriptional MerR regulator